MNGNVEGTTDRAPTATERMLAAMSDMEQAVSNAGAKRLGAADALYKALEVMETARAGGPIPQPVEQQYDAAMEAVAKLKQDLGGTGPPMLTDKKTPISAIEHLDSTFLSMEMAMVVDDLGEANQPVVPTGGESATAEMLKAVASMEASAQGGGSATGELLRAVAAMEASKAADGPHATPPADDALLVNDGPQRPTATQALASAMRALAAEQALAAVPALKQELVASSGGTSTPTEVLMKALATIPDPKKPGTPSAAQVPAAPTLQHEDKGKKDTEKKGVGFNLGEKDKYKEKKGVGFNLFGLGKGKGNA